MATWIIMRLTFLEAVRRKIALAAFLLGLAFLILYALGFHFTYRHLPQELTPQMQLVRSQFLNFFSIAGLYAVNFLAVVMAALISADSLSGEITSGTIQTIASKPVRRIQIVLGKWIGLSGLLAAYLLLMAGGIMLFVYLRSGYVLRNILSGIGLIYLESVLLMTVTLACSSIMSTLASAGTVFGLYGIGFVGGWVEQIGAAFENQTAVSIGILSSLLMPAEALWKRAAFEMTSPLVRSLGVAAGPFAATSVPSPLMIDYALLYLATAFALAVYRFNRRDL